MTFELRVPTHHNIALTTACDGPSLDATDGFTPRYTYESLQDTQLRPSGRIANDYADAYIRLLGLSNGNTV